ncbi:MAG: gamma-glutamyl-gamma-aminobutyrate hydrolase family protein [Acidimicrobiia bacterium]|nr:gamma-glutamyl-gamma-aminobutyrate hydrolase family protein [Acidimicrobiia bacterium]
MRRPPRGARPLVAVTGRPTKAGQPWRARGFGSQARYAEALDRAGGLGAVLLPVPTSPEDAATRIAPFAGLLLSGGPDVEPSRYGAEAHPATYGVDSVVDSFEEALLVAALARRVPVLAICRGLQVLNVAFGGTLHQHLDDAELPGHRGAQQGEGGSVVVEVVAGSRLAGALGTTTLRSACFHHQAVDRLGGGLVATARSADGVVEGLELVDGEGWLVAVQWHPEELAAEGGPHHALFEAFVAACAGPQPRFD